MPVVIARASIRDRAQALVLERGDAEAMHAIALLNLTEPNLPGSSLDAAISSLRSLARTARRPTPFLIDVSAAYLARAERTQNVDDLAQALDAVSDALRLEPTNPAARYNHALIVDRWGLDHHAKKAWERYLMVDSKSEWAVEARVRLRQLTAARQIARPPQPGAAQAEILAYVANNYQEARLYAWNHLLDDWGAAVLSANSVRAAALLNLAEAIGVALERRGGEAALTDAVRSIRGVRDQSRATEILARAHCEYAAGERANTEVNYESAERHFGRARDLASRSPALYRWATVQHAFMLLNEGSERTARAMLDSLAEVVDTARYPVLAGRTHWVRATVLLRGGQGERALTLALTGVALLEKVGEQELAEGARYVAADAQSNLGAGASAYQSVHRSITTLRSHDHSLWRFNALAVAARTAEANRLYQAALGLHEERVAVAAAMRLPVRMVEARLARARVLAAAGELAYARADIAASQGLLPAVPSGFPREWVSTELQLARAAAFMPSDPARAETNLDSALTASAHVLNAPRRLRTRVARAETRLARGDVRGAVADLDSASEFLAARRDAVLRSDLRAALTESARGVFDRLALLSLGTGDTTAALRYLERGRNSFGPTARGNSVTADGMPVIRSGEVAVVYTFAGDTLLLAVVSSNETRLQRLTMSRDGLARDIEDLRSLLERGVGEGAIRSKLVRFYEQFVRPVETRLGGPGTSIVLIADGEIAAVPFAALYDMRRRSYFVRDHPIRYASSLRDASRGGPVTPTSSPRALLVADPAFAASAHPGLQRLTGARAEGDSIAAIYPRATLLADTAAAVSVVKAALEQADVVHVAGHAMFDDMRPERSYIPLAPDYGTMFTGALTAIDLEKLNLEGTRLVVLSACRTLRSRAGRSGGFAGFAGAVLDAGAQGVIGSLWDVDDRRTTPLMVAFHRAYRRSGDGPGALREAQLSLLSSSDPALRSPAVWAAFRYAGN